MQICEPHERPHVPQFELLLLRSAHAPAQQDCPLHERPQAPQFKVSIAMSTHVPLHPVCPLPQHVPLEQFPLAHCALLVQLPLFNLGVQLALLQ
jgi:hypothetical protein